MRTISAQSITDTVARLCIKANTQLPQDVQAALENFTFANLVNRENCLTGESFVSHNIMDYAISHSDQFTPEQRARIRHVLLYSPLIPGPKAVQEADTRSAPDGLMELPIRTAK